MVKNVSEPATDLFPGERRRTAFGRQVRDALAHLYDVAYLQTHPLAQEIPTAAGSRPPNAGKALRETLLDAIEELRSDVRREAAGSSATAHPILTLRYVEGLDVRTVQKELNLGKSEYYREQQRGLEAVISLLWERWQPKHVGEPEPGGPESVGSGQPTPRTNLPAPVTRFIGRERESAEVARLILAGPGEPRLVTLSGPGGSGKTRLALHVAAELVNRFPAGVWLTELAPLADPRLVAATVMTGLAAREEIGRPTVETLVRYLKPRGLLLVLDNVEHLIPACAALVTDLLRSCPRLRILATGREPLGIAGEVVWRAPALSVPPTDRSLALEEAETFEAVQLFVARATAARPKFALTARNTPAVAEICWRLDGLPLAIELAAARVAALSAEQIASRLDHRFRLLTGGGRTSPRHQQTLQATLDWSYNLLSGPERALLRRLAVFAGGWTLEAAEAVCGGDGRPGTGDSFPGLPPEEVLDLLGQLVGKSLVQIEDRGEQLRYSFLETVRVYAEEKLSEAGETAIFRTRHCGWYADLAERGAVEMLGPGLTVWADRLTREHDNLRAALGWSKDHDPDLGLRLVERLWRFLRLRAYHQEGIQWLSVFLERVPVRTATRAWALIGAGDLTGQVGDAAAATCFLEEGISILREIGDETGLVDALRELAGTKLSFLYQREHDSDDVRKLLEESLDLARKIGYQRGIGLAIGLLGSQALAVHDDDRARILFEDCLGQARQIGDPWSIGSALYGLGWAALRQGDLPVAWQSWREVVDIARSIRDTMREGLFLEGLALLARTEGRLEESREFLLEALRIFRDSVSFRTYDAIRFLGDLDVRAGFYGQGVRLLAFGATQPTRYGLSYQHQYSEALATCNESEDVARAALGEEAYTRAWGEGQAMTLEEAIARALQPDNPWLSGHLTPDTVAFQIKKS